jgi:hypothetical protein
MGETCYVRNLKHIACHHYNRDTAIVTLEEKDGEISGVCPICETEYISQEVRKWA